MSVNNLGPLDWRIPIVTPEGRPTLEFQRRWATQIGNNNQIGGITIGSGPPPSVPTPADGDQYADTSTTPYTLYIANGGVWYQAGSSSGNPTAVASDVAVNGTAGTFMRSDAAPAVQKASSSQFGIVKVDGTTITESGGVISASGGGGGGRQFARSPVGTISTSNYASKGSMIVPIMNMNVSKIWFYFGGISGASYKAGVYTVNGSNTITGIVSVSPTITVGSTSIYNMLFDVNATLTTGTKYAILHTRTDSTNTTSSGLYAGTGVGAPVSCPVEYQDAYVTYATNNPGIGATYGTTGTQAFVYGLVFAL